MAIRNDFTIDWSLSPRVITIAAPSTECDMQSLLDTLRFLESEPSAMEDASIVDASGKETLDETTKVGITVTLQNAVVGFEARPGPSWIICSFVGGNLVAVDPSGTTTESVNPTAYVSIKAQSSSSATLQEQDALQYSSYGGVVSVDLTSSNSGIKYPIGNMEYPVNNFDDAVDIGNEKGFAILSIRGDANIGVGDLLDEYILSGQNPSLTHLTIEEDASVDDCTYMEATITGTLDGNSVVRDCRIDGLDYISGAVRGSELTINPIYLGTGSQAMFIDCWSGVPGTETPTIDMGGTGQKLGVRGYNGGLRITNRTGSDPVSIDMVSGHVILDATCTGDPITIRGTYKLTVEAGATQPVTDGRVIIEQNSDVVAAEVWDYVI